MFITVDISLSGHVLTGIVRVKGMLGHIYGSQIAAARAYLKAGNLGGDVRLSQHHAWQVVVGDGRERYADGVGVGVEVSDGVGVGVRDGAGDGVAVGVVDRIPMGVGVGSGPPQAAAAVTSMARRHRRKDHAVNLVVTNKTYAHVKLGIIVLGKSRIILPRVTLRRFYRYLFRYGDAYRLGNAVWLSSS